MRNFFQKIMLFMQGRYGMDALNGCLLILAAVITPTGDPFTLLLVTLPIYALYELSILLIRRNN